MKDLLLLFLTSTSMNVDTVKIPIKYPRIDTVVVENAIIAQQINYVWDKYPIKGITKPVILTNKTSK